MALLATQVVNHTGLTPAYSAVAASDTFKPDGRTFIHVKNTSGTADTCVVSVLGGNPPGLTISNVSVTVPSTTGDKMIGPFAAQFFADPTTSNATVTHTQTTSVTCAVLQLDPTQA